MYIMPYRIEKVGEGYKVCDPTRCFSEKPLPKKRAMKQRVAIVISEHKRTGKPMKSLFV
jgi:hypothetical protein